MILVKVTLQRALHMARMERRECDASPGIMRFTWAQSGRLGRSRVQVCVDCTLSPLGSRAMRGTVAGIMLMAGTLVVRKWLVAPASVAIDFRRMEAASA